MDIVVVEAASGAVVGSFDVIEMNCFDGVPEVWGTIENFVDDGAVDKSFFSLEGEDKIRRNGRNLETGLLA